MLAAVEHDPCTHCAAHEFNFPGCAIICRSICDIDGDYIRSHSEIGDSEISVVAGGPPCQGFSLIGKRALDDPRNNLVGEFVRLVSEPRPRYFVFENVKGLTIGRHRKLLEEVIEGFKEIGYSVRAPHRVLNALRYGVPQSRERLSPGCQEGTSAAGLPGPDSRARSSDAGSLLAAIHPDRGTQLAICQRPMITTNSSTVTGRSQNSRLQPNTPSDYARAAPPRTG